MKWRLHNFLFPFLYLPLHLQQSCSMSKNNNWNSCQCLYLPTRPNFQQPQPTHTHEDHVETSLTFLTILFYSCACVFIICLIYETKLCLVRYVFSKQTSLASFWPPLPAFNFKYASITQLVTLPTYLFFLFKILNSRPVK